MAKLRDGLVLACIITATAIYRRDRGSANSTHLSSKYPDMPAVGMVKVHKAASSTLLKVLQRLYFQEKRNIMYPSDSHLLGWPDAFPGDNNNAQIGIPKNQYDFIGDHAVWNYLTWSAYLKPDPVWVLLAREPSSQAVSAYNFFNTRYPHNQREIWPHHLDWLEDLQNSRKTFKASMEYGRFLNPQSWDMGWYEYVGMTNEYDQNSTKLDEWIAMLDRYFGGLGGAILLDQFDPGLVLLGRRLGVNVRDLSYVLENEGKRKEYPTDHQDHRIAKLYNVDRRFYSHFNATFWSHWQANNDDQRDTELTKLRDGNAELEKVCEIFIHCPIEWTLGNIAYTRYLKREANR